MMRDRILNRKYLVLGLIAGIIASCFICLVLSPQIKSYDLAKKELAAESAKLLNATAAAASVNSEYDRLIKARKDYEAKCTPFKNVTRDGSDIILLGLLAASENIVAAEVIPGDIIEKEHTLEMPVKVVLQGDYRSLTDFCREIESDNSAALIEIRSLWVQPNVQATGVKIPGPADRPGALQATIGMVMFSVRDPEGKLYLEELSKWLTGRNDVFRPAASVTPAPELSGYLKVHSEYFPSPSRKPALHRRG